MMLQVVRAVVQLGEHQDHGDISHHIKTLSPWVGDDDEFRFGVGV